MFGFGEEFNKESENNLALEIRNIRRKTREDISSNNEDLLDC